MASLSMHMHIHTHRCSHPESPEGNVVKAQAGLGVLLLQQANGRLGGGGGVCAAAGSRWNQRAVLCASLVQKHIVCGA
jgi:hypothetical protein